MTTMTKREKELGRNYAAERRRAKELRSLEDNSKITNPEIEDLQKQKDALDAKIKDLQKSQAEILTADEKTTIRTLAFLYSPEKTAKLLNKSVSQIKNVLGGTEKKMKHCSHHDCFGEEKCKKYILPKLFRDKTGHDIDWKSKSDMVIYRVIRKELLKSNMPKKKLSKAGKRVKAKRAKETDQERAERIRDLHQRCSKCHKYTDNLARRAGFENYSCSCRKFTHHLTHWKEHDKMKECPYCFGEGKWTTKTTIDSGGHRLTEYDRYIRRGNIDQIDWVRQHRPNGEPIPKPDNGSGIYDAKGNDLGRKISKVVVVPADVFIDRKTYNKLSKREKKAWKSALNNLSEEQLEEILKRKRESKK